MEEFDKSSLYYVDSTPEGTRYSLYDTASWKNGLAFKNIDFSESGLPVIKIAELNNGISSSTTYTDKTYSQDVFLTKGDYVFSWSGNPETSIDIYKYNLPDGWLNQHIFKVTPKTEIIDKGFFFYLMKFLKPYFKKIATNKQTTGLGHVTISDLQRMSVALPPLPTQQKIAAILSSLDDKIELNNKINTNLEQQAQALFKNWFVDFEPFGGKMPERWKVGTIGDLCSTISKTYKSNDSHVVLINTSDVENGIILNHESVPNSNLKGQFKKTFQKGDILYSEIRPANKHYAFVDIDTTSNYIASTKLMVIRPNEDINPHYLYHILTNPDLIQEMQHLAETRSGTFPQITFESELSTYQIPLLPKEEQDKLGELFEKIDNQIFHNIKENKMLSTIRNTLLPKVMNGEIEV